MDTKNKRTIIRKCIGISQTFFGIVVFLILAFFVLGQLIYPDERDVTQADCKEFHSDWYRVMENGEKIPVEFPDKLPAEYGEVVTLTTTLPQDIYNHENLCFRLIWQDLEVYIDGELRQKYNTEDSRPYGTNSALRYVFVELYETDAGKELTYQFSSNSKYAGETRPCYIGDKSSIWFHFVRESGMKTIISLMLMFMSLCCIIVCVVLTRIHKKRLPLYNLAWALFFSALWMLSETDFRQLLFKNVSVLSSYTYWSLMLIPISLLIYINDIQRRRYEIIYVVSLVYSFVTLIVGTILQVFDIVQFVEQLPFIHGGIAVAIVFIIATITIDAFKKRLSDYFFVGIGIYGMLISAAIEMYLYYADSPFSIGTVLSIGLVFLLVMAIVKTAQDFLRSEQKKNEAIMASKAQAQFLASMSHEIRTPINAVIGMNEMILRESNDEVIHEYADNIQRSSNMLLGLINNVLDFSKIESGRIELVESPYDLATLIQDEMLLLNTRAAGKAISTQMDVDSGIPAQLYGDELRIKQVLTNILSNAVKYTTEGTVTLKAFFQWLNNDTIVLHFSVIDTGSGIRQEDLAHLFESFKRLDVKKNRNIEGTGLGLNISKNLVELMNGSISVDSEYGKGSNFTISIPQKVVDPKPIGNLQDFLRKQKKVAPASDNLFTAPDAAILVVDDNAINLSVVKGLLKRTQVKLDLAVSGKECLEYTKHNRYDIILMDHMMPEMDGIETLKLLRNDVSNPNWNTVVIALTANAIAGCREMYLEHGFDDYFAKPIKADQLDAMLIQYLPETFVHMEQAPGKTKDKMVEMNKEDKTKSGSELDYLEINLETGMFYCGGAEDLYQEILSMFCNNYPEYLQQLEIHFKNCDWKQYAIMAHALKSNALNIGATNFSKLSLQHELAGKGEDDEFIRKEFSNYIATFKKLVEKAETMLESFEQ